MSEKGEWRTLSVSWEAPSSLDLLQGGFWSPGPTICFSKEKCYLWHTALVVRPSSPSDQAYCLQGEDDQKKVGLMIINDRNTEGA